MRAGDSEAREEPPQLVVIVDTKPPEFDLRLLTLDDKSVVLQCDVYDANPDPSKATLDARRACTAKWL